MQHHPSLLIYQLFTPTCPTCLSSFHCEYKFRTNVKLTNSVSTRTACCPSEIGFLSAMGSHPLVTHSKRHMYIFTLYNLSIHKA